MVQAAVALRIDVDTRRGLDEGVPRLLELFRRLGVRASFFVTMGPDRSGLVIRRAWRPGFVAKMWRTRAWRIYGARTLLSGAFLSSRPVGAGAPALLRTIAAEGHEVAPHGFDHVRWQDRVHRLPAAALQADLVEAAGAFERVLGRRPEATAAPGWRTTEAALTVQDQLGYRYATDVRGRIPFVPEVDGRVLNTMQIAATMPTMDELIGRVPDVVAALEDAVRPGLNVLTAHAEVEGGEFLPAFRAFLEHVLARGVALGPLADAARDVRSGDLPVLRIVRGRVPGRSGWITTHAGPDEPAIARHGGRRDAAPLARERKETL